MITKIIKMVAIAALLMAILPQSGAGPQVALESVICLCGVMVLWEAARARKYIWLAGFGVIATLFNPFVPVAFSHRTFLWLDLASILMFLSSLAVLHARPLLSMPSITNRTPGSESL
jgi:hypothetical protein